MGTINYIANHANQTLFELGKWIYPRAAFEDWAGDTDLTLEMLKNTSSRTDGQLRIVAVRITEWVGDTDPGQLEHVVDVDDPYWELLEAGYKETGNVYNTNQETT